MWSWMVWLNFLLLWFCFLLLPCHPIWCGFPLLFLLQFPVSSCSYYLVLPSVGSLGWWMFWSALVPIVLARFPWDKFLLFGLYRFLWSIIRIYPIGSVLVLSPQCCFGYHGFVTILVISTWLRAWPLGWIDNVVAILLLGRIGSLRLGFFSNHSAYSIRICLVAVSVSLFYPGKTVLRPAPRQI